VWNLQQSADFLDAQRLGQDTAAFRQIDGCERIGIDALLQGQVGKKGVQCRYSPGIAPV
jgi:hypothetical protein